MLIQNRKDIFSLGFKFFTPFILIMLYYLVIEYCTYYKKATLETSAFTSSQPDIALDRCDQLLKKFKTRKIHLQKRTKIFFLL